MDNFDGASRPSPARARVDRRVAVLHVLALIAAGAVVVLGADSDHWHPVPLLILAASAALSDLIAVETGSAKLKVSGCMHGIMVAAVVLGGGPAAVVGVTTILIGWLRWREAGHYFRNNLVVYICFPLIGGRFFHAVSSAAGIGPHTGYFYVLVFATFVLTLVLNFVGIAGYQSYLDGIPLIRKMRETLLPLIGADLSSAVLTMATVYVTINLGTDGLLLFAVVLLVFQYLVGELLKSKQRGEALTTLATRDELTGLANRNSFREYVETQIAEATPTGASFAVMLMDLDNFKEVNDTLGHHYGDELLRQLGPRLEQALGSEGFVARLGGDEFAFVAAERTSDPERLETVGASLLRCLQQAFLVDELSLEVGGSIGISRFPIDGPDASTLLRHADAAMYAAKEQQSGCGLYTPEHDAESAQRLMVLGDFRRALGDGELVVHYQPIVDLERGEVHGAESLIRWNHPELGLLPPDKFVSTIERTGMIGGLTRYVLQVALERCAVWRVEQPDLAVSVNLSVRNLLDHHLIAEIEQMLEDHRLPPSALRLEITESMLMSDPERARRTVYALSELGVQISIDDFGTGYSSLASLRDLPIDELKIDRSFVTPMLRDESFMIIVRSTINLAHDLNLNVTAEGVEDQLTLKRLTQLGCDRVQGYHLGRPMPADEFAKLISRRYDGVAA